MRRLFVAGLAAAILLVPIKAQADLSPLEITEEDGSPSTFPYQVKFSNGTVTDNGDGTTSVVGGSPAGAEYVVTESHADLTAEVAPSAANQVPNSTSSTAGSWTADPTVDGLTLNDLTAGSLVFAGTGGLLSQDNSNLFWDDTNNRLGIGTTGPSTKLHVASGQVLVPAGSVSAPALSFGSDTNSGFYTIADGTLSMSSNGVTRWLAAANTGETPAQTLRLDDSMGLGWSTDPDSITDEFVLYRSAANTLRLTDGAASAVAPNLIIDGNVGIGTTGPGAKLQVNAGASTTIGAIIKGAASQSANLQEWQNSSGTPLLSVEPLGQLRIASTWDLSTDAPTGGLVFVDNGGVLNDTVIARDSSGNLAYCVTNAGNHNFYAGGSLIFSVTPSGVSLSEITLSGTAAYNGTPTGVVFNDTGGTTNDVGIWRDSDTYGIIYKSGQSGVPQANHNFYFGNTAGVVFDQESGVPSFAFTSLGAAKVGLVVKGASSQSANLQEWQDSSGNALVSVTSSGAINMTPVGGDTFGIHTEGSSAESSLVYIRNNTSGTIGFMMGGDDVVYLGQPGSAPPHISVITDGTGDGEVRLPSKSIGLGEVDFSNSPTAGQFVSFTGDRFTWSSPSGSGDVTGPASSTDNAVARFDGTGGKTIQNSGVTISDTDAVAGVATLDTGQGANELYDMDQNVLTTSSPTFVDLTLAGAGSDLTIQATGADAMGFHSEASVPMRFINETDSQDIWRVLASNKLEAVTELITTGGATLNGTVDMTASSVVSFVQQKGATIFDPDTVQTTSDAIPLFEVDAVNYPFGIRLVQAKISTNASTTLTYALEEWTTATGGVSSTLKNLSLSSASEATFTNFADATVAAGSFVFINFDTTALNWVKITVWFYALTS